MAEEKADKREDKKGAEAEQSPKKRSKVKLIGIGTISLALLGGGGYVGYKKFVAKDKAPVEATVAKQAKVRSGNGLGPLYKMNTFIVNLAGDSGSRYLKATMQLEMSGQEMEDELDGRTPQVRDLVLTLLSSKTFGDISTSAGKFALREEVVSRVNEILTAGEVRQVYFTEFVVQ
jgi:flagellar FliL protein